MVNKTNILRFEKKYLSRFIVFIMLCPGFNMLYAQEEPPAPISIYVNASDGLVFGTFFQGNLGGTITIDPSGARSVTGDVGEVNLGIPFSPAIFNVTANPGTIISILTGPEFTLTGSNGGSMQLEITGTDPELPFVTIVAPPGSTQVKIGGTLTVGSAIANPPGIFTGTFSITFIQE